MLVVAQSIILKSVLFKSLMRALPMYFLSVFSIFQKCMRVVDQKHNYQLEWPYTNFNVTVSLSTESLKNTKSSLLHTALE